MNDQLLNAQNITLAILTVAVILLTIQNLLLQKRFKRIFKDKNNNSLEGVISDQVKKMSFLEKKTGEMLAEIQNIKESSRKMIQKANIKRYNPFQELGSDQSFTISLLDGNNNGLLVTGLHSREGVRVYAKPVEKGTSRYKLSNEEQEILKSR